MADDALDHRHLDDREQLLGRREREGAEAGALAPHEDDRSHGFDVGGAVEGGAVDAVVERGEVEPGGVEPGVVEPGAVVDPGVTGSVGVTGNVVVGPTSLRCASWSRDGGSGTLSDSGRNATVISSPSLRRTSFGLAKS
jgi:hypothetical protein